jgi:hypothetical protein
VASYIRQHQHLPDIPSEADVRANGVSVGEKQAKRLAKIEELTLHMVEADQRNDDLPKENRELRGLVAEIQGRLSKLERGAAAPKEE